MTEELKIIIAAETEKLRKELDKAQKEVEKLQKKGKEKFSQFNDEFQKVGAGAKKACAVMAGAIAGAATAILALGASTQEYRQQQAKLTTAFEAAGAGAAEAKATYNDLYRTLGDVDKATEAAAHLAQLTTNQKDLSQWTTICQGVYATFGDSLPIEGLTEAANETAKVGTVTGALADALNWAGISEDAFNEKLAKCNSEAAREKLIRETLNGLYSDTAALYEENNAQILAQNEANQKMTDSMAKIGEAVAPINTALTQLGADVLAQLEPYITQFAEDYLPQITAALSDVGTAIGEVLTWVFDNWELISTIAIVIASICAALSVFSTVMGIVNAVMAASPVTWIVLGIVAAIAALVAIIVVVIKYWDEIKEACIVAWNAIVDAVTVAVEWLGGLWGNIVQGAKDAWQGIKDAFGAVGTWFKDTFSKAWQAVKNVFSAGGKIFDGIKEGIANVFKTIVNGIIGGINKVIAVPFKAINKMLSKIRDINILGVSPFSWIKTFDVPQIPKLAKGGIIDSTTLAVVGEQGKEAVMPLENNLEWLDKLAAMLSDRMGGNQPIVLEVDGKVFAQTAISTINANTRQTGQLQLSLV